MTKWCNNCEAYKDSWNDKNYSGYKYHVRCWSCDKWSLAYSSDKNLYDWWGNGITGDQKDVIAKFGVDTSSSSNKRYDKSDLKKLWYWSDILERNRWDIGIPGRIQQANFFSSWWNNNLIIIISGEGSYSVNLIVYEIPMKTGDPAGGSLDKFWITSCSYLYSDDDGAKKRVKDLESTLKGENPILYRRPPSSTVYYSTDYSSSSFPARYENGEVKRIELPYYSAKDDPDKYIKPLDIVKRINDRMVHTCVYLGNRKIAHAKGGNTVEIDSWSGFFDVNIGSTNKLLSYHPVIAFKKPEKIIEHVAKTVEGRTNYFCVKGNFGIDRNNCESFANRCVLGLNFSELADKRGGKSSRSINFKEHLDETSRDLDNLASYPSSKISDIKVYRSQGIDNRGQRSVDREGIEMQNCIEVQPKEWYRLNSPVSVSDPCPIS